MIELIHEHTRSPCAVRFIIDEDANIEDLEAAFTHFIRACGYSGRLVVLIEDEDDHARVESAASEMEWFRGHGNDLCGAQPAETSTVKSAIEESGNDTLVGVLITAWRQGQYEIIASWENGYEHSKDVSEELKFLADLLRGMED